VAVVGADVVDGDDVGVREAGERLRLAEQSGVRAGAAAAAAEEHLEGDLAIELRVVGGVDDAHAALTERAEHDVAADLGGGLVRAGGGPRRALVGGGDRLRDALRFGDCL
jgi:hypothetical protein